MKLNVGDRAPDFKLPGHLGYEMTFSSLRGKMVVLFFFPQAWTPILMRQVPSYQANLALFEGMNVQVLGISVDPLPSLKALAETLGGISYPLLSDFWPHGQVADRYGVLRREGITECAVFIVDKNGIIRYINLYAVDEQPDNEVLFKELALISPAAASALKNPEQQDGKVAAHFHGNVIMYCTSWCPDCRKARSWLKEHNIDYTEIDIERIPSAADQVRKWANGNRTTPTFDIDGEIIVDFQVDKLELLLLK